jgi:hypothetical protein
MTFVMEKDESAYPVNISVLGARTEVPPAANFTNTIQ